MLKLQNRQEGITLLIGLLIIVVIAVVGAVGIKTSDAYFKRRRTARPVPAYNFPTRSTNNTGSQATCSANGSSTQVSGTGSATVNCSNPSSPGTPGVNNTTIHTSQGADGAAGTASCTVNGQPVAC